MGCSNQGWCPCRNWTCNRVSAHHNTVIMTSEMTHQLDPVPGHCNSSTTSEFGFASTLRGHQKNEIPKRCSLSVLFEPWLAQGNGLITAPSALWELRCLEDELPHRARVGQSSTARLQRSTQVLTWNSADLDEAPIHHHHGCEDGFRAPTHQATSFRAF